MLRFTQNFAHIGQTLKERVKEAHSSSLGNPNTELYTGRHSAPATLLPASERAPSVRHLKFKSFGSVSYNIANL